MCCKHRRPEVRRFQHDPNAFTQGLLWSNGSLFESTGLYGESTLRELQLGSNGSFAASSLFCCVLVSLTLTCRLACVLLCSEFALMVKLAGWKWTMDSTTQTRLQKMCPFSESLPFAACYSFLLADGRRDIFQTSLSSCPRVAMSYVITIMYDFYVSIIFKCTLQNSTCCTSRQRQT